MLTALLIAEAMEQLIELTAHCAYGVVYIGGCLLHQVALLSAYRRHTFHKAADQFVQYLGGLLAGAADQGLNGRAHDVVQRICECRLHGLVHPRHAFLQAIADAFVQLLQGSAAFPPIVGDMH